MSFDPNLPAARSKIRSAELRNQFNGLKELIDEPSPEVAALTARVAALEAQLAAQAAQIAAWQTALGQKTSPDDVYNIVQSDAPRNVDAVSQLPPPWSSNPPERDEFNEVRDKVNELVSGLVHPA